MIRWFLKRERERDFVNVSDRSEFPTFLSFSGLNNVTNFHVNDQKRLGTFEPGHSYTLGRIEENFQGMFTITLQKRKNPNIYQRFSTEPHWYHLHTSYRCIIIAQFRWYVSLDPQKFLIWIYSTLPVFNPWPCPLRYPPVTIPLPSPEDAVTSTSLKRFALVKIFFKERRVTLS